VAASREGWSRLRRCRHGRRAAAAGRRGAANTSNTHILVADCDDAAAASAAADDNAALRHTRDTLGSTSVRREVVVRRPRRCHLPRDVAALPVERCSAAVVAVVVQSTSVADQRTPTSSRWRFSRQDATWHTKQLCQQPRVSTSHVHKTSPIIFTSVYFLIRQLINTASRCVKLIAQTKSVLRSPTLWYSYESNIQTFTGTQSILYHRYHTVVYIHIFLSDNR